MEASGETILVADDDPYIGKVLTDRLQALGYRVLLANGGKSIELLDQHDPEMALLDVAMPDFSRLDILRESGGEKRFSSRDDYRLRLHRPCRPSHAGWSARFHLQAFRARSYRGRGSEGDGTTKIKEKSGNPFQETAKRYHLLVGRSPKMNHAIEAARKAAHATTTVCFSESGTGKELFARAIHTWSERNDRAFVAINCVGLSKELLESELFGHEKGAFTGAHQLKRGKMELAHSGTVFLDEVGDISPEVQAKLLRFLQEREFERVGGTKPISVNVRIIAATNRDLAAQVQQGHFREDLYHRLNVILITLPSLKDRAEDIPELCQHFLTRFSLEAKRTFNEISGETLAKLCAYDWPGNVRELANVIEQAVVLGQGTSITVAELPPRILSYNSDKRPDTFSYRSALDNFRRELVLKSLLHPW